MDNYIGGTNNGVGLSGSTLANSAMPIKQTELQKEGENLSFQLTELQRLLSDLESKIEPIMRGRNPQVSSSPDKMMPETGLAKFINEKASYAHDAVMRIKDIIQRIEI